jgi:hypothetical protein
LLLLLLLLQIFPINIKVSAGTIVALTSWTSGWFVSYAFNFMFEWSAQGLYFLYYFFINLDKTIYQKKLRVIFIKIHKSNIKLFKNRVRILTFVSNSFRCAKCAVGKYLLDSRFLQILLAFVFLFRLDDWVFVYLFFIFRYILLNILLNSSRSFTYCLWYI